MTGLSMRTRTLSGRSPTVWCTSPRSSSSPTSSSMIMKSISTSCFMRMNSKRSSHSGFRSSSMTRVRFSSDVTPSPTVMMTNGSDFPNRSELRSPLALRIYTKRTPWPLSDSRACTWLPPFTDKTGKDRSLGHTNIERNVCSKKESAIARTPGRDMSGNAPSATEKSTFGGTRKDTDMREKQGHWPTRSYSFTRSVPLKLRSVTVILVVIPYAPSSTTILKSLHNAKSRSRMVICPTLWRGNARTPVTSGAVFPKRTSLSRSTFINLGRFLSRIGVTLARISFRAAAWILGHSVMSSSFSHSFFSTVGSDTHSGSDSRKGMTASGLSNDRSKWVSTRTFVNFPSLLRALCRSREKRTLATTPMPPSTRPGMVGPKK
mmetsp:Transcript_12001/g.33826  ORF Transcript_12001/g.33826 Transcript_12001/m.33826 type:complete len:376 (-) Transcript_12001:1915-3042(-)